MSPRGVHHMVKEDPSAVEEVGDIPVEVLEGKSPDFSPRSPWRPTLGTPMGTRGGTANAPTHLLLMNIAVIRSGHPAAASDHLPQEELNGLGL